MAVTEAVAVELVTALSCLVRTARSYSHARHEQLGASGVTFGVLKRLSDGAARLGDVAEHLGVTPSAVSRAVASLESHGYVVRTVDPSDARACSLRLTAAGTDALAVQHRDHARRLAAVLEEWDDASTTQLCDRLGQLDAALNGAVHQMRHGIPPSSDLLPSPTVTRKASV